MLDEVNQFDWPGFDVRPLPGGEARFSYGFIPPKLYQELKATLLAANKLRKMKAIPRD